MLPCWTVGVKRMESTMTDEPKDPAPAAAKPACTIIKQKHSRWWEVRDSEDELVCLTVYRKGAREVWYGGSPPDTDQRWKSGSRGEESPAAAAMRIQRPDDRDCATSSASRCR
jgi:hypothetical protein